MYLHTKYLFNFGRLKKYGENRYKLTVLKCYKQPGIEDRNESRNMLPAPKGTVHENKLANSLSRSKSKIFELAYCNPWELFVTLTLDKTKYDRSDLKKFQKDLSQFIRDIRKKHGIQVKYLLIPELHSDGQNWHMHGFLMGLPLEHLHEFQLSEHLPDKIRKRLQDGKRVFDWTAYSQKFGFSDIEIIENNEAASKYITKYVTKEAYRTIQDLNAHIYYASKGLAHATVVRQGIVTRPIESPDFENEYCDIKEFTDKESALSYFYFEREEETDLLCFYPNTLLTGSTG